MEESFDVVLNWTLDQKRSIVVGDFNCDFLGLFSSADHPERTAVAFSQFLLETDLHCFVNTPTRDDRCLDAVFSNDFAVVAGVSVAENFSTSDHAVVWFDIASVPRKPVLVDKFGFRKCDWQAANGMLFSSGWPQFFPAYPSLFATYDSLVSLVLSVIRSVTRLVRSRLRKSSLPE